MTSLLEEFNCPRGNITSSYMIAIIFYSVGTIVSGRLNMRYKCRTVWRIGLLTLFTGYFLLSICTASYQLSIFYDVICGLAHGILFNTLFGNILRFSGQICARQFAADVQLGLSGILISPVITFLLGKIGWRNTFFMLSLHSLLLLTLNFVFPSVENEDGSADSDSDESIRDTFCVLGKPFLMYFIWAVLFYCLAQAFIGFATACGLDIHASDMQISLIVSVQSIGNATGRLTLTLIYARLGFKRSVLLISLCHLAAIALLIFLLLTSSYAAMLIAAVLFGYGFSSVNVCHSCMIRDFYGSKNFTLHIAAASLANLPSGPVSTLIMNFCYTSFNIYIPCSCFLFCVRLFALLLGQKIRCPEKAAMQSD